MMSIRRFTLVLCSLLFMLFLSACAEEGGGATVAVNPDGDSVITVTPPSFLQTRAVNPDNLFLTVTINDSPIDMDRQNDGRWSGSVTVNRNDPIVLIVTWEEDLLDGQGLLLLARAFDNKNTNVIKSFTLRVDETSFISTGPEFDFDSDEISNLEERKRGFDPRQPNLAQGATPDVQIFANASSTKIDGRIGTNTFWSNATYTDTKREKLTINNMIRDDVGNLDENTKVDYQWVAIHDEEYLTIFVYGKIRDGSAIKISGDSGSDFFKDDSLEIYWDGNLSRLPRDYDGVDDMLINIPLARGLGPVYEENHSGAFDKRIYRGGNVKDEFVFDVLDENNVSFATCFCDGERTTWEVRINLAAAKIPVGKTFGFELQINRDDNGGERDSKWAWAKPPRQPGETNEEADVTWRYPIHMGKALLRAFPQQ